MDLSRSRQILDTGLFRVVYQRHPSYDTAAGPPGGRANGRVRLLAVLFHNGLEVSNGATTCPLTLGGLKCLGTLFQITAVPRNGPFRRQLNLSMTQALSAEEGNGRAAAMTPAASGAAALWLVPFRGI